MLLQNKGTNPQNRNVDGGKDAGDEDVNAGGDGYDKGNGDVVGDGNCDGYDVGEDICEADDDGDDECNGYIDGDVEHDVKFYKR